MVMVGSPHEWHKPVTQWWQVNLILLAVAVVCSLTVFGWWGALVVSPWMLVTAWMWVRRGRE